MPASKLLERGTSICVLTNWLNSWEKGVGADTHEIWAPFVSRAWKCLLKTFSRWPSRVQDSDLNTLLAIPASTFTQPFLISPWLDADSAFREALPYPVFREDLSWAFSLAKSKVGDRIMLNLFHSFTAWTTLFLFMPFQGTKCCFNAKIAKFCLLVCFIQACGFLGNNISSKMPYIVWLKMWFIGF